MSITELGALGEFIGSIAVLITLIYLSVQVRQNTRHVRAQMGSDQVIASMHNEHALFGPEPAMVLQRAVENPNQMTYADFRVLHAFLTSRMELWVRRYRLEQMGLLDSNWRAVVSASASWFFGSPVARLWLNEMGPRYFPTDFVEVIQAQLEREPGDQSVEVWHRIQAQLDGPDGVKERE